MLPGSALRSTPDEVATKRLADALVWLASSACFGPTPVKTGIARCEDIRAQLGRDRRTQADVLDSLAGLWAMRGSSRRRGAAR